MTRDLLSLLEYEAKHNQSLARLIADLPSLTKTEIEQAKVKLPWIRQALLRVKQQQDSAALAAQASQWSCFEQVADPVGEMRRWIGANTFVKVGRGQLEVTPGQLLWLNHGMWIDTIFYKDVDPQVYRFSQTCGIISRSGYIQAVRQRANSLMPVSETISSKQPFHIYRVP